MNKCKSGFSLFFVFLFIFGASISASAATTSYQVPQVALNLELPEGSFVFTPATADDDPSWKEAGLESAVKYKTEYNQLGTLAHFSANGGKTNVYLGKKESDTTRGHFSLATMTKEELEKFLAQFNSEEEGMMSSKAVVYNHPQTPFFQVEIRSTVTEGDLGEVGNEYIYFTIINGYTVSFTSYDKQEISAETKLYMKNLVDSVKFTEILEKPKADPAAVQQALWSIGIILAFIALIIAVVVINRINRRRRKNATRRLADQLSQYRQERAGKEAQRGEPLFENSTEHSDAAVRVFSKYYIYVKKPIASVVSIAIAALGTAVSIWAGGEWWMSLLVAAVAVFCTFKFVTAGTNMEKAQKRVYSKLRSRTAKYSFYPDEFTISGMQSTGSYPYFQITEVDEWKDYFYIYFGEGNAHYVSKNSFTKGNAQEFKKFIVEKTGKKLRG